MVKSGGKRHWAQQHVIGLKKFIPHGLDAQAQFIDSQPVLMGYKGAAGLSNPGILIIGIAVF